MCYVLSQADALTLDINILDIIPKPSHISIVV